MSVARILSNKPAAVLADPVYISHRIDPNPFKPEYIHADLKLDEYSSLGGGVSELQAILKKGKEGLSGGATPLGANYKNSGVRFIRSGEVNDCWIDGDSCVFISPEDDQSIKRSKLKNKDVLLTITGACFGKSAEVTDKLLPANISQHSVRMRFKESLLTTYVVAYLNSKIGQLQILKHTVGSTRHAIDYIGINKIRIPIPDMALQKYIGGKLQLAEKCREEAIGYLVKAKQALSDSLGVDVFSQVIPKLSTSKPLQITSITPSCSIVYPEFIKGMIGAHAYDAIHAQVELNLQSAGIKQIALGRIVQEMVNGYDCRDFSEKGTPYAKVAELKPGRLIPNPKQFILITLSDVPQKQRVKKGDLLVTRKGSFGICANATEEDEAVVISSEIIRLRLFDKYDSAYVSLFLNSNYGRSKFDRLATGTMMLGINHGNLSEIEIPILDTTLQKQIGDNCRVWQEILKTSEALVQAAKYDVEALIEGKLDTDAILSGKLKAPTWEDIEKELEGI